MKTIVKRGIIAGVSSMIAGCADMKPIKPPLTPVEFAYQITYSLSDTMKLKMAEVLNKDEVNNIKDFRSLFRYDSKQSLKLNSQHTLVPSKPIGNILKTKDTFDYLLSADFRIQIRNMLEQNSGLIEASAKLPKVFDHEQYDRQFVDNVSLVETVSNEIFLQHPVARFVMNLSEIEFKQYAAAFANKQEMIQTLSTIARMVKGKPVLEVNEIWMKKKSIHVSLYNKELPDNNDVEYFRGIMSEVAKFYKKFVDIDIQYVSNGAEDIGYYFLNTEISDPDSSDGIFGIYSFENSEFLSDAQFLRGSKAKIFVDARIPLLYKYIVKADMENNINPRIISIMIHELGHSMIYKHMPEKSGSIMQPHDGFIDPNQNYMKDKAIAMMRLLLRFFEEQRKGK